MTYLSSYKKSKKKFFSAPSFEEIKRYYDEQGITEYPAERFYSYYTERKWIKKDNKRVCDWRKEMDAWRKNGIKNNVNLDNNDTGKKVHGTDTTAGYREDEDWRALGEWLDAHHPVSAETIAAADEALKNPKFTLKWWGYRIGTTATIRIVIKKLYRLGEALNTSKKGLKPEKLERIANEIMRMSYLKTFEDLDIFFTQCKQGQYGNFPKGLQMTDILRALGKYLRP